MKDPSSIAIYRYLVSVDLLWIFYPSRRQDSGIQHGPTQVSSLQTVWLCDMLCHRPPEERVDQASLQFLKEETSSTSVNCKTTSPDYVLPPPPAGQDTVVKWDKEERGERNRKLEEAHRWAVWSLSNSWRQWEWFIYEKGDERHYMLSSVWMKRKRV